ncbi:DUF4163 domain-containing protein [Paenibacillus alba]|uniref:PdaC/SigV domain-containing protein n=1 Tax=Paenibacillus alba TaxID=1197127 RepID=UPI00156350FA|nr:DUF4163 domain-containing protein [Paenibacillus alba]
MKKSSLIALLILFSSLTVACGNDRDTNAYGQIITPTTVTPKPTPDSLPDSEEKKDVGKDDSVVSNPTDYEIVKEIYTNNKNIIIHYPQINNLSDNVKQNKVNQIIKDNAYGYLKDFSQEEINNLSWDINYRIAWESKNLLSIQYSGYSYDEGAAHPVNQFYSTNIDMEKLITLKLKDLINIDEDFVTKLKKGSLKSTILEQSDTFERHTNQEWVEMLNNADSNESEIKTYLTKDSIGISVEVAHVIGDHAEFEIKYEDLSNNAKYEYEIWKEINNSAQ